MNIAETPPPVRSHQNETLLRKALADMGKEQRAAVMRAGEWTDDSSISKVVSGAAGIKLETLDAILAVLGLTIVEEEYMDYLAKGNTIGANCCRARKSLGICRPRG